MRQDMRQCGELPNHALLGQAAALRGAIARRTRTRRAALGDRPARRRAIGSLLPSEGRASRCSGKELLFLRVEGGEPLDKQTPRSLDRQMASFESAI